MVATLNPPLIQTSKGDGSLEVGGESLHFQSRYPILGTPGPQSPNQEGSRQNRSRSQQKKSCRPGKYTRAPQPVQTIRQSGFRRRLFLKRVLPSHSQADLFFARTVGDYDGPRICAIGNFEEPCAQGLRYILHRAIKTVPAARGDHYRRSFHNARDIAQQLHAALGTRARALSEFGVATGTGHGAHPATAAGRRGSRLPPFSAPKWASIT